MSLRWAESRFAKPRKFPKRRRVYSFCIVQKVTEKHVLGRAKSCRWQVFVRRRPPKQGELRTDVSKATMFQGDRKVSKGFNFVRGKVLFGCAASRLGKPRSSRQGNGFILFACTKRTKSTPEVCEPLDSGERFKSPLDT